MDILNKIERRFTETKSACKLYVDTDKATRAADREVAKLNKAHNTNINCPYIVTFVPSQNKFTVIFNFSNWLSNYGTGTYIGWFAQRNFFSI